jgi:hypothetical protein
MSEKGRFVWNDLMTSDPEASLKFYTELFGWETREVEMGEMGKYTFIKAGGRENGGMVTMDPAQGIPAHWLSYLTVDDVDELVRRAEELGLEVRFPPTDIPEVGRFSVVADPAGAVFAAFKAIRPVPPTPDGTPPAGAFCWNELLTHDPAAAGEFYRAVCGWGVEEVDMGDLGTYTLYQRDGREIAGMMQMPPDAQAPSMWLLYVAVDDVDDSAKKIGELNGTLFVPPKDIPNVGRFAVAADPTGATFAIYKSEKN